MFHFDARAIRPRVASFVLFASCAGLAACGGGNPSVGAPPVHGSATPSAVPTATPTTAPTATPTAAPTKTPVATPTPTATATAKPTATPTVGPSPLVLSTATAQFEALGVTTSIGITGPASTNFGDMTVTSSNPKVATAALDGGDRNFDVTSVAVGTAVITVVPSDGSAGAAHLTVQGETTTIEPEDQLLPIRGAR